MYKDKNIMAHICYLCKKIMSSSYKNRHFLPISAILFALIFVLNNIVFSGCYHKNRDSNQWVKQEGFVWNTSYHITYFGSPSLKDSITSVLDRVGKSLSAFDPSSIVSRVNNLDSTLVNDDFIKVYVMSRKIHKISHGAFDPTLGPLIRAWGFGQGHKITSDTLHIDSLLKITGIEKTCLSKDYLIKQIPEIEFNFSAIAKGYGCDAIGEMLKRHNVGSFLIEIGGEICAAGLNPEGKKWRVSIDTPFQNKDNTNHSSIKTITFSNMGMATSGNYRNFHTEGSNLFGHTISSKTGRPFQTEIISSTVLAPSAMEADALATAFMAMSKEESKIVAQRLKLPVMFVLSDSTLWMSAKFTELLD